MSSNSRRYAGAMTDPTTPGRPRPLRIVDLVIAILLAIIGGLIGLIVLSYLAQYSGLSAECDGVDVDGVRCSPAFLSGTVIAGYAIVIFAWFVTSGLIVVRAIRRRLAFFLPIIGVLVMIAGFWAVTAVIGASYLPAAG
jgi:hypothetical protein